MEGHQLISAIRLRDQLPLLIACAGIVSLLEIDAIVQATRGDFQNLTTVAIDQLVVTTRLDDKLPLLGFGGCSTVPLLDGGPTVEASVCDRHTFAAMPPFDGINSFRRLGN